MVIITEGEEESSYHHGFIILFSLETVALLSSAYFIASDMNILLYTFSKFEKSIIYNLWIVFKLEVGLFFE